MTFEEIISRDIDNSKFCVVDVETTGLSPHNCRIIEIGIIKIEDRSITDKYSNFIHPGCPIPYNITALTGIDDDDVLDAPSFDDIAYDILDFLEGSVIVAHNVSFDVGFLTQEFARSGITNFRPVQVCTVKLARRLFPELRSRKLGSVCKYLRIKNEDEHRAQSDARATARIFLKMLMKTDEQFGFKYVEELVQYQFSTVNSTLKNVSHKKFHKDLSQLPDSPGIYYYINKRDEIIYIGKAKSLRERLRSYLLPNAPSKTKKIVRQAKTLKTELTNSELTALLAEAELIKKVMPRHNRQLKSYRDKYFLKIDIQDTFPNVELINKFDFDGNDYFGLFISRKKAEKVKDIIDKSFQLRECKKKDFEKEKSCLLAQIERCTEPCQNKNRNLYQEELSRVYEFLEGDHETVLKRLIGRMKKYSEELKFEKAAEMKELADLVLAQIHRSSVLKEPINKANVLLEIDERKGKRDYILLLEGKVHIKRYILLNTDEFDISIDEYYEGARRLDYQPTEEDLEKLKIILNWIVKNRNYVRVFYLKEYKTTQDLMKSVSKTITHRSMVREKSYDLAELTKDYD